MTGVLGPRISLATLKILSIGRTRANHWGYVTCVFCDLTTDTQSIVNSLTDFAIYVVTENVTASSVADLWSDTVAARQ
jgi:hypothetical protein